MACELYINGSFNGLFVRKREKEDPKSVEIPRSIRKAIENRASKASAALSTPTKEQRPLASNPKTLSKGARGSGDGEEQESESDKDTLSEESDVSEEP